MKAKNLKAKEAKTLKNDQLAGLTKARIGLVGFVSLVREKSAGYVKDAYELGDKITIEKLDDQDAAAKAKGEASVSKVPDNTKAASAVSKVRKVGRDVYGIGQKAGKLQIGLVEKVGSDSRGFIDELMSPDGVEEPKFSYKALRESPKVLATLLREKGRLLIDEAEEKGREHDLELRKRMFRSKDDSKRKMQQLLSDLGFASKADVAEINRKILGVALLLENGGDEKAKNNHTLERRRVERRSEIYPINYEQRLAERRLAGMLPTHFESQSA